jgi:hypothetical protein
LTLSNPKSLGWAFGEILTSAQMNSLATQLPYALDGAGGGAYTLSAPLSIDGDVVTIETLVAPTISGVTTFTADVVVGDDLLVADDATVSGDLGVSGNTTVQDLFVLDDLDVTDDAIVRGDLAVVGQLVGSVSGILHSLSGLEVFQKLRLHAGDGWDSNHNLTVGTEPQLIDMPDGSLTGTRTYAIQATGAGDGDFFLIHNGDLSHSIVIDTPSASAYMTIQPGKTALLFRVTTWRGMVFSPS